MSDDPLQKNVQFSPGVGPHRAELLAKLGIRTVEDLLWHLPRDLLDLTEVRRPKASYPYRVVRKSWSVWPILLPAASYS